MSLRLLVVLVVLAVGGGAFALGRATAPDAGSAKSAFRAGYLAGREDAFGNFDGGWGYGEPYVVELRRGGPHITYAVAERWPMKRGVEYRLCGRSLCSRPSRAVRP